MSEAVEPKMREINILAQYLKDISFESPLAPQSLFQGQLSPEVSISVNVLANQQNDEIFEVVLKVLTEAKIGENVLFLVDVTYASIVNVSNIPEEERHNVIFIQCPHLLFPFVRYIISDATRNGGFPPLLINAIDFASMYKKE